MLTDREMRMYAHIHAGGDCDKDGQSIFHHPQEDDELEDEL